MNALEQRRATSSSSLPCGRVVIRTHPLAEESVLGYVARVSQVNGYNSPYWLLNEPGKSPERFFEERNLLVLSSVLGCDARSLAHRSYFSHDRGWNFFENPLREKYITYYYAKLCPVCIAENCFAPAVWDIAIWTACPLHNIRLIYRCPYCGLAIPWDRCRFDQCACGFDLLDLPAFPAHRNEIACAAHLAALTGWRAGLINPPKFHHNIMSLNLDEFVNLAIKIGSTVAHGAYGKPANDYQIATMFKTYNETVDYAISIMECWPIAFFDHIEHIASVLQYFGGRSGPIRASLYLAHMRWLALRVGIEESVWNDNFTDVNEAICNAVTKSK